MLRISSFFSHASAKAKSAWAWGFAHKVWSAVIIAAVLGGGYIAYAKYMTSAAATQYVLTTASRGNIVVTVSGSGQVAANQEIGVAPKSSGEVTWVGVRAGDQVTAGEVIARIDDTDAEKSLRDAQTSLTSAEISYKQALASADTNNTKAIGGAASAASAVVNDLPQVMRDLDDALHGISNIPAYTLLRNGDAYAKIVGGAQGSSMADEAEASYQSANDAYKKVVALSAGISAASDPADIQAYIESAYAAASAASIAISDTHSLLTLADDKLVRGGTSIPASFTSKVSTIASDDTKTASDASDALSAKDDLANALLTVSGDTPVDIQSAELSYQKAQNALADAEDALSDYEAIAPFAGTIAKVSVQTHDTAGGSSPVATLVTNEQYAQLSLNEVDAAKVKAGQKAELTFDAIDGLTLSGTVAEVDSIGTVSQGVVTYDVKISFDEQDPRVRSGMTVNADITADSKEDALIVPSSAVETVGGRSYVQVVTNGAPALPARTASTTGAGRSRFASSTGTLASSTGRMRTGSSTFAFPASGTASRAGSAGETVDAGSVTVTRVPVETGLTNDTQTEIVSGLTDGATIVARTVTASATAAAGTGTARTTSAARGGFGGGAVFRAGG